MAIATILISAALLGQVDKNSAYICSGVPVWTGVAKTVQMQSHSVTMKLANGFIETESISVLKNLSSITVSGGFAVQEWGQNWKAIKATGIHATVQWDRKTLVGTKAEVNSVVASQYSVTIKPNATHSILIRYRHPVGLTGMARDARLFAYEATGFSSWQNSIGRFNFSIQWDAKDIFRAIPGQSPAKWQVGNKGAYFQASDVSEGELITFGFYPNSFDNLGGGI